MNKIVELLMERDNITYDEANNLLMEAREHANTIIENDGSILEVEEILEDYFGLDPDYIFDLIEL